MTPPLPEQLAVLGLRHTAAHLDDILALATKRRWSPTQLLEHLVESEQQERTRRSLERRLARSRLGRFTPMTDFDWAWPKRIDRPAVEAVLRPSSQTPAAPSPSSIASSTTPRSSRSRGTAIGDGSPRPSASRLARRRRADPGAGPNSRASSCRATVLDAAGPGRERAAVPTGGRGPAWDRGRRVPSEPRVAVQGLRVPEPVLGVAVRA
jgi:hypothetical protein